MPTRDDRVTVEDVADLRREITAVANMTAAVERRVDKAVDDLPAKMAQALKDAVAGLEVPSEQEREYLRLATRAAARREKLQEAIIEKTLVALVWAALTGCAIGAFVVLRDWSQEHLAAWLNVPRDVSK